MLDGCHVLSLVSEHVLDPLPEDLALRQGLVGQPHGHLLQTLEGLELRCLIIAVLVVLPHQVLEGVEGATDVRVRLYHEVVVGEQGVELLPQPLVVKVYLADEC